MNDRIEGIWLSKLFYSFISVNVTISKFNTLLLSQYKNVMRLVSIKTCSPSAPNKLRNTKHSETQIYFNIYLEKKNMS